MRNCRELLVLVISGISILSPCRLVHSFAVPSANRRVPSTATTGLYLSDIAVDSADTRASPSRSRPAVIIQPFTFQGYKIHAEQCGPNKGRPVILIHGFGCSTTYWRETTTALANEGYNVHAIDLLGQGKSEKPSEVYYSINLWAQQVDAYAKEVVTRQSSRGSLFDSLTGRTGAEGIVLVGNSLGSTVALAAAVGDHAEDPAAAFLPGRVGGLGFYNCGVGLNARGVVDEPQWSPLQRLLATAVLNLLDAALFDNPPVLAFVLGSVVTPALLEDALRGLYRHAPARVDAELVASFYGPARDAGAPAALGQIYTNEPGLSPMQLHEKHEAAVRTLPIHLVWGDDDVVTPMSGGVGTFYSALAGDEASPVSMDIIAGTGHIPFDDNPVESNGSMLRWLKKL